jgi:hypothetical protein
VNGAARRFFGNLLLLAAVVVATPAYAQTQSGTWNGIPERFQIDAGYFHLNAENKLTFEGGQRVDFEKQLGLDDTASTFWLDATWRLGRRHQIKLDYTRISRDRGNYSVAQQFTWGGNVYDAGLSATTSSKSDILAGYYRFAVVRHDRFEIGPAIGFGYLWVTAAIDATGTINGQSQSISRSATTGSPTGALGAYVSGWPTQRLFLQGDFLYIKVKPSNSTASLTDWRAGANYYFLRNAGLGVQYKYDAYRYDREADSTKLGGEIIYDGFQAYLSFRF